MFVKYKNDAQRLRMKPNISIEQQQFLELLRAGIWNRPADSTLFQGRIDWKTIFNIAKDQAVQILVADGMGTLPEEMAPKKQTIYKIAVRRITNARIHKFQNSTISRITTLLNAEGIPSILLKGQGIAQNYPNPESRMCGDIDIYVGLDNFDKACEIMIREGAEDMTNQTEHESHIALDFDGSTIEIHKKSDVIYNEKLNSSLQEWNICNLDKKLAEGTLPQWNNEGTLINLPGPTHNAFYIIHHAVRHMLSEGIGLRHVCDWMIYLHKHRDQIDIEELKSKLIEYNMLRAWDQFGALATEFLGFNTEDLLLPPVNQSESKAELLLKHIFNTGNFGRCSCEQRDSESHYITRKMHNFRFQMSRIFKLYRILPEYTLNFGYGWFTNAVYRFFRNK